MESQGLVLWLAVLLTVRAVAHQCLAYQAHKQVTAADAARTFALEWQMEATAHVASLMIRDQQCKGDPSNCDLQEGSSDSIDILSKWAVGDKGWERLLSSVSLYAIARHAYQEAEYDEAIIALEESLALRLFAYADQKTLDRWQQGLVMPNSMFRRQKMELANTLVLRADCLLQLAREQRDVDDLTEAMELLQLATALLKAGDELGPDSIAAISRRAETIASVAAELLPQLKISRVQEVLQQHGIACSACSSKADFLVHLVPLLRLPVQLVSAGMQSRSGDGPLLEPVKDPFSSHTTALLKQPQEHIAQYMQRLFFRLLTLVPADYLAELNVSCRRQDAKGRCISYLPQWVTARAITIDKRTGEAHVATSGSCSVDGSLAVDAGSQYLDSSSNNCGCPASSTSSSSSSCDAPQVHSEPSFVSGDAAAGNSCGTEGCGCDDCSCDDCGCDSSSDYSSVSSSTEAGGLELCGFLHIRSLPPGVALPAKAATLTTQQQKALQQGLQAAYNPAQPSKDIVTPFKGVYYHYSDIPALVDHIVSTVDQDEADFLLQQLDALTAARSLGLAGQHRTSQPKNCNEQTLLEGKAPPSCSVLMPNIGSCAASLLQPPRKRLLLDPIPTRLGLLPPTGTYSPRMGARVPDQVSLSGRNTYTGQAGLWNDGGDNGEAERAGSGQNSGSAAGGSRGRHRHHQQRGQHYHHHHHHRSTHFPLTDRELSDRQLQEQMAKLAQDTGRKDRDDPVVPLTLAGCAVASVGLYLASKRRRRGGSSSTSSNSSNPARLVLLGLGTGRLKANSSSGSLTPPSSSGGSFSNQGPVVNGIAAPAAGAPGEAAATAALDGDQRDNSAFGAAASRHKRQVAAALRVAMNSTDTAKLEAAFAEAEAADLQEAGLLQRAKVMLDKRKKKDQAKAAAEKARLKAKQKEEARKGRKAAAKQTAPAGSASEQQSRPADSDAAAAAPTAPTMQCSGIFAEEFYAAAGIAAAATGSTAAAAGSKQSGRWSRFLQVFGIGACGAASLAATGALSPQSSCDANAGVRSAASMFEAPAGECVANNITRAAAAEQPAAPTGMHGKDAPSKQQQLSRSNSSSSSNNSMHNTDAAADSNYAAVNNNRTGHDNGSQQRASGSTAAGSDVGYAVDLMALARSTSSDALVCNVASAGIPTRDGALSDGSTASTSTTSSKRGKSKSSNGSTQQQRLAIVTSSDLNSANSKVPVSAASNTANYKIPAGVLTASYLQSNPPKASKSKASKSAAAASPAEETIAAAKPAVAQYSPNSKAALASVGVTAPVTPPAAAVPPISPGASGGRASPSPVAKARESAQQQGAMRAHPMGWAAAVTGARKGSVSEDGSGQLGGNGSIRQQQQQLQCDSCGTTSAPGSASKPKLNPMAAPYNPSSARAALSFSSPAASNMAAGAAVSTPNSRPGPGNGYAGNAGVLGSAGRASLPPGWHASAALGTPVSHGFVTSPLGVLPARGLSPAFAGGAAGMLPNGFGPGSILGSSGVSGRNSSSGGMLNQQQYGHGDAGMHAGAVGLVPELVSLHSADVAGYAGSAAGFSGQYDPGHISPSNHYGDLAVFAGMPQPGVFQHMQQQQLVDLLSAAGPAEDRYGITSAGGSAPVHLALGGSSMDPYIAVQHGTQHSSYSCVPNYLVPLPAAAASTVGHYGLGNHVTGCHASKVGRSVPPGFEGVHLAAKPLSAVTPLNLDDDQLPPGFSAEDYTITTPSSISVSAPAVSAAADDAAAVRLAKADSIPTTAPLGVFPASHSVWGPLAETAGSAAATVAAGMRSLWSTPLVATSSPLTASVGDEHVVYHDAHGGYSRSQELEVEVAAAATSANVAELVLGSSPSLVLAGSAEAHMNKLFGATSQVV